MKSDNGLYKLIYEYFETRLLYGYYACGDSLPSIARIGDMFRMAPGTVRSALALLEKKGYIRIDARKTARVIYEAPRVSFRKNAALYFVPRRNGIMDLAESGKLLFEPLWEEGLRRMDQKTWDRFCRPPEEPFQGAVSMPVSFYIMVLSNLNNRLILDLYWETIRYIRFPYLDNKADVETEVWKAGELSQEEVISALRNRFEVSYGKAASDLFAFMDEAENEFSLKQVKQIPFCWDVFRSRPQRRYSLASRIIREIIHDSYPAGSYLPSLPHMADRYGVGMNTIRRALDILEDLGMTRSYHGKGTIVCTEPEKIEAAGRDIREGIELYQESLQLLALTISQVLLYTLRAEGEEVQKRLGESFSWYLQEGKGYLCFEICITFIVEKCPLALVRECYQKIRELLPWGYPFSLLRMKGKSLHSVYAGCTEQAVEYLKNGRPEEFADSWRRIVETEESQFRAFIRDSFPVLDPHGAMERQAPGQPASGTI